MGDWMFDDGSAASLLEHDLWEPVGAFQPEPPPPTSDSGFGELYSWGNDDPPVDEVDEVVIIGFPSGSSGGVGGGGGRGGVIGDYTDVDGDPVDRQPIEPERSCTPPPDGPTPAGVDMDELRRKARDLANEAAGEDDGVEWGGLIWQAPDGTLHSTSLTTSGSDETALFDLGQVGPGGRIVATFHTHPERNDGVNQGVLNSDDRDIVDDLQAAIDRLGLNISIDPEAMMYVKDNESGVTKEFDVDDPRNAYGTVLVPCGSD